MKVILLEDVKSLGKRGELVEASDGYARNYLLPRKLAKEANAQAMNEYKNAENSKNYKIATQKAQAEAAKKQLEGKVFRMTARAGQGGKLFGSITSKQVAEEIKKQYNIAVDKRKVVLECDIKEYGTYKAEVKLFTGISANIDIQVKTQIFKGTRWLTIPLPAITILPICPSVPKRSRRSWARSSSTMRCLTTCSTT